jgi:hypothetical protein
MIVTCANGAIWWRRAQVTIRRNPELREGYIKLICGWLLFANVPWVVMGIGILFGGVPSIFHYFNPRNGPMVVAWYATIVALWIASVYWLFFRQGAETLIEFPGLLSLPGSNPRTIKLFFLLCLAGGVAGLLAMLFGDIPVPPIEFAVSK